mmetsp:Transcript_36984/g.93266  ORF Transcript_36984/g.93266 Transcript_36984/m.93266 type:complete len:240 (+) Transcript_36984:683-1402(+)
MMHRSACGTSTQTPVVARMCKLSQSSGSTREWWRMWHGTATTPMCLGRWVMTSTSSFGTLAAQLARACWLRPRRTWRRSTASRSTRSTRTSWPPGRRTRRWRCTTGATCRSACTCLRATATRCSRSGGAPRTRPSWRRAARTGAAWCGTCRASATSSRPRTRRTARPSCCSSTAATPPRSATLRGTPATTGWWPAWRRTTSCRSGRWRPMCMRRTTTRRREAAAAGQECCVGVAGLMAA